MRELSAATGHTRSYLRQQLRKFGLQKENTPPLLAPYGWDWADKQLVENEKEQAVLSEILSLNKSGKGCKLITAELNRRGILSKTGKLWRPCSVQNILNRERKKQKKEI